MKRVRSCHHCFRTQRYWCTAKGMWYRLLRLIASCTYSLQLWRCRDSAIPCREILAYEKNEISCRCSARSAVVQFEMLHKMLFNLITLSCSDWFPAFDWRCRFVKTQEFYVPRLGYSLSMKATFLNSVIVFLISSSYSSPHNQHGGGSHISQPRRNKHSIVHHTIHNIRCLAQTCMLIGGTSNTRYQPFGYTSACPSPCTASPCAPCFASSSLEPEEELESLCRNPKLCFFFFFSCFPFFDFLVFFVLGGFVLCPAVPYM